MKYDPEKTSMAIQQQGGGSLNPLTMIHQDVQTAFTILGEHKKENDARDAEQGEDIATLKAEVKNLKESLATLQTRLWGLLAGVILAGAGVAWQIIAG